MALIVFFVINVFCNICRLKYLNLELRLHFAIRGYTLCHSKLSGKFQYWFNSICPLRFETCRDLLDIVLIVLVTFFPFSIHYSDRYHQLALLESRHSLS